MNKTLILIVLMLVAGFAVIAFLANAGPPDTQQPLMKSLEAMKSELETAVATLPAKQPTGDFPIPSKVGPWPKVAARDLTFSFGQMQVKTVKSHSFTIRNEGEADLQLTAGTTTCKCTQFDFDPSDDVDLKSVVVKPGESVDLIMTWKAGDDADRGFRHGGDVHTNDPQHPLIKYAVEGAIERPFEFMPSMWNIGGVSAGQTGRFKGAIATRLFDGFQIESVHSASGLVKVTPVPMTPEEKAQDRFTSGYSLQVELSEATPAGTFEEDVEIKVSGQEQPIRIHVSARKYGAIRLQQLAGTQFNAETLVLQLGAFPATQGREAKMLLIVDEKDMQESFRLTETTADPSFLKATLTPLGEPTGTIHRYILSLAVPPGTPHVQRVESKPGSLKISTNHPTGEEISMSVLLYSF